MVAVIGKSTPSIFSLRFFLFEFMLAICLWVFWISIPDLQQFQSRHDYVLFDKRVLGILGVPFLYGIKIAAFIGWYKRLRDPREKTGPMTLTISKYSVILMAVFGVFGGFFAADLWASINGYKSCFKVEDRHNEYLYVPKELTCPPPPTMDEYLNGTSHYLLSAHPDSSGAPLQ